MIQAMVKEGVPRVLGARRVCCFGESQMIASTWKSLLDVGSADG
jgi:hypothetical protein